MYKEYNDLELLSYINEANEEANLIIFEKYEPLIKKEAYQYHKVGSIELDDLIQQGRLGLAKAIETFIDKDVPFYVYAKICIHREIALYYKKMIRFKNKILSDAVSFDNENDDFNIENIIGTFEDPLDKIYTDDLLNKVKDKFSDFEYNVLLLRNSEYRNEEIAKILNKNKKDIENCIRRIRKKLRVILTK